MAQQINLLTPILLAPRRYFSALALLQAAGLLLLAGLAAAGWMQFQDRRAAAEHRALMAQYAAQRQQLIVARAQLPPPQDAIGLQQQLQALEAGNAQRQALLASLGRQAGQPEGPRHAAVLALLARTLPEAAWLTEVRHASGRLELAGGTLDPAVLRPWLAQLSAQPLLAGQALVSLRVERVGAPDPSGAVLADADGALARSPVPVWGFRVISAAAPVADEPGATP